MTSPAFEAFLARIYVDAQSRAKFLNDPAGAAREAGLTAEECEALEVIDRQGLEMAARSFARKRETKNAGRSRLARWLRRSAR
jgi:hypothetical protein